MILTGRQFTYGGFDSSDYKLRFMWLDEKEPNDMAGEKSYDYFEDRTDHTFKILKDVHEEPLSYEVEILSSKVLTKNETREIYAALFNRREFHELSVTDEDGTVLNFNCLFSNPKRYEYGIGKNAGIVGFACTMTLDSAFAYTEEKTVVLSDNPDGIDVTVDTNGDWVFEVDSDDNRYIYPEAIVVISGDATNEDTARITNRADRIASSMSSVTYREITFECEGGEETITMSPKHGTMLSVSGNISSNKIAKSNKRFIRLLRGKNIISHENVESITLKYREARVIV